MALNVVLLTQYSASGRWWKGRAGFWNEDGGKVGLTFGEMHEDFDKDPKAWNEQRKCTPS